MRVNEVLETMSEKGIVAVILARDYYICAYVKDLINNTNFIERKIGDRIVTHLGVTRTSRGFGIVIECFTNKDYEVNEDDS